MVEVILSFIYIFIVTLGVGLLVAYILSKLSIASVWQTEEEYIFTPLVVMGIVGVSVGVEYHSIFGKIGIFAHIILLLASFGGYILNKKRIPSFINQMKEIIFSWEGLFYFGFILLISFYGSRGIFHTDTNIYHAQNIRLYEEYGLIKGMGNLQQHYAYNSSYLAFASIFSLGWLFGDAPLHTTTAFLEAFAGIYAFFGLKRFREHKLHLADGMKIAILFYILVIITGSMSPATDYGTMLMSLILMSLWCDEMEGRRRVECYGLLAVLAVFVLTMKFSACLLVLLAVFPAVMLIKEKQIKKITAFLLMGVMVLAPFFIRNYLIGGWLLYPADFIDIFDVEWKIPKEHLLVDSAQIKVWGRCLYDINLLDLPLKDWFPIWLEHQDRYEMMLVLGIPLGGAFSLLFAFRCLIKKMEFRFEFIVLLLANLANIVVWFFMAPFIRYGLAFILTMIFLPLGCYVSEEKKHLWAIVSGMMAFACVACITPYFDNYIKDAGSTMKQTVKDPYYLIQKPYDDARTGQIQINGNTIYYCDEGEINSYYYVPNTCYAVMLERSELMGENIRSGFKPK